MFLSKRQILTSFLFIVAAFAAGVIAQKPGDGSVSQRLDVMRQKLETIRRSATSAASVLKQETKDENKDEKENLDTPYTRLRGIEKEASTLQNEVNSVRGKVDRSEKYEASDIDRLENDVADLQRRSDAVQTETAQARAIPESSVGKRREIK
jgi:Mg2+ and Co2+ transporter CorA